MKEMEIVREKATTKNQGEPDIYVPYCLESLRVEESYSSTLYQIHGTFRFQSQSSNTPREKTEYSLRPQEVPLLSYLTTTKFVDMF